MPSTTGLILRGHNPLEIIVELAIIWACVWLILRFLRGTRGAGVIKGFAVIIVVLTLFIQVLGEGSEAFGRLRFISDKLLGLLAILLIVVFQPELRQAMIRVGQTRWFSRSNPQTRQLVDDISEAAGFLSKNQFGAIIIIERNVGLGGIMEGAVLLDASLTPRLLESIFWPNNPLHDLAVIIRDGRIAAANVMLPLAEAGPKLSSLGSRHRAAVGITLESDCIAVVVSEENGMIRLAESGNLVGPIQREDLTEELLKRLDAPPPTDLSAAVDEPGSDPSGTEVGQAATESAAGREQGA